MSSMEKEPLPVSDNNRTRRLAAIFLLAGLLSIYVGQSTLSIAAPDSHGPGIASLLVGVVCLLLALLGLTRFVIPETIETQLDKASKWLGLSPTWAAAILFAPWLSYLAWAAAGESAQMALPFLAVGLWLAAILITVLATWQRGEELPDSQQRPSGGAWIAMIALGLVALGLRLWHLGSIPWVLAGDEASAGLSGVGFIQGTQTNIFGMGWYSFPALYFLIPAASIKIFGQTIAALRFPSALAGAITVPLLYLFARKVFSRGIATISAVYLAAFHFHIHFSRIGLNNVWDPLVMVLVWGFLWMGWQDNDRRAFGLAGLTLGFGFYLYTSFRILGVMIPIWLAIALLLKRHQLRQRLSGLALMLLATLTVSLPLALFYSHHVDEFFAPMQRVSVLGAWMDAEMQRTGLSALQILWDQFRTSALAFTTANLRHWYAIDHPMLFPLQSTFFLLGVLLMITRLKNLRYVWLALWILGVVVAGALSESTPAAQRYVMAAPAVCLLIGIGLSQTAHWLESLWPQRRSIFVSLAGLVVVAMIWQDLHFYFGDYTPSHRFSDQNTAIAQSAGMYLASKEPGHHVVFFGAPRMGYDSIATLRYLAPQVQGTSIDTTGLPEDIANIQGPTTFMFTPWNFDLVPQVERLFPGGKPVAEMGDKGMVLFVAYEVP
jgi:4-amino-4-deoxy-L-arabinose transferase-like glycosyltransferase